MKSLARTSALGLCALASAVFTSAASAQIFVREVELDPRATFLRTNTDPYAIDAQPIRILSLGLHPGDWIRLEVHGDFSPRNTAGAIDDTDRNLIAVFSATETLLPGSNAFRVSGAIDAATDHLTPPTYHGNLTTDLSQDFFVDDVWVQIPAGTNYLFAAAEDSYYSDNVDPDGDFALWILPAPEPATAVFSVVGMMALMASRRRVAARDAR